MCIGTPALHFVYSIDVDMNIRNNTSIYRIRLVVDTNDCTGMNFTDNRISILFPLIILRVSTLV